MGLMGRNKNLCVVPPRTLYQDNFLGIDHNSNFRSYKLCNSKNICTDKILKRF